jgi:hypothetical protein
VAQSQEERMTDQEQRNLAATVKLYELSGIGDWEGSGTRITDDFFVTEAPGLPFAGVYRGLDGYRALFTTVTGAMDVTGFDIQQMTAGGDWVVVLLDIIARDADGSDLRIPIAEAMRFRGDKCCEIRPYYFDHTLVARAVAAKTAMA